MDNLAWETLATQTSYTCEGFDVVTEEIRLPNGTITEFDYLEEGDSVVILPFDIDGNVVVIEEWRQAVGRVNRGLPAGNLDGDENPTVAAHRELAEETGHEAADMAHLTTVEPANGFADTVFHYFVARQCKPTTEQSLDYNESIRVDTTSFEELLTAARDGEFRDGRTMLAISYFALFERD